MSAGIDDDKSSSKNRETDSNNFREGVKKESRGVTTLKVAEAEQRDVGRKIARIDPK
jgi:hypothetical protein